MFNKTVHIYFVFNVINIRLICVLTVHTSEGHNLKCTINKVLFSLDINFSCKHINRQLLYEMVCSFKTILLAYFLGSLPYNMSK